MSKYQLKLTASLPRDLPFRDERKELKREVLADDPQELWQNAIREVTQMLGFGFDANLLIGLLLNMINSMPTEVREAVVAGIVQGNGLTLENDNGTIVVDMGVKFDPLSLEPNRRPSGLIIPT